LKPVKKTEREKNKLQEGTFFLGFRSHVYGRQAIRKLKKGVGMWGTEVFGKSLLRPNWREKAESKSPSRRRGRGDQKGRTRLGWPLTEKGTTQGKTEKKEEKKESKKHKGPKEK